MPNFSLPDEVFARAAMQFPTPFFLYDEEEICRRIALAREAFSWAPSYTEYFAVKALPNPHILRLFTSAGQGLDCASLCELLLADKAQAKHIMFSANDVPSGEFCEAARRGAILNLDDVTDIDQILRECGAMPETVSFRLNPGDAWQTGNRIMGAPLESKYGWAPSQIGEGMRRLKELGVKRFGIHALLASNELDARYYASLARLLMQTAAETANRSGIPCAFVNLSGGVGIPYHTEDTAPDLMRIGGEVEAEYRQVFGDPSAAGVGLCTEMGRWMTGPCGWLVTKAIHHKDIFRRYVGVDASGANLPRPFIYGAYHHISVVGKRDEPHTVLCDVVGSLCENTDKFAVNRMLPPIEEGDLLLIHDAGAHCISMGHHYNGRLQCAEVLRQCDGSLRLIRRAETPEDYFATLVD